MTHVDDVPRGVDPSLWSGGRYSPPAIGDLWLLSWDLHSLALGVVSGVARTYVLLWPVSLPADVAFPPAVRVPDSPLGVPLAVWPTRETGVGMHLLDRRFGQLLSERVMARTLSAIEADETPPLAWIQSGLTEPEREVASDLMIDLWEEICLHTWPVVVPGASPLSASVLGVAGVGIAELVEILQIDTPDAVALFRGEHVPTTSELRVLAEGIGCEPNDLLEPEGEAQVLADPKFKSDLVEASRELGLSEAKVRDLVRSEFALAARSDGDQTSRVVAAIQRVRQRDSE